MKKITALLIITGFIGGLYFLNSASSKTPAFKYHTEEEIALLNKYAQRAPIDSGEYFLHSHHCTGCHGYDSIQQANINEAGDDVNLSDRWRTSMMALSAKDPLWRAKVSHESIVNPGHAALLQNKCTQCHAPMGRYTSMFHNNPYYGISDLVNDTLGLDGVSCGACHMISPNVGHTFSGVIPYDTNRVEYGPFGSPFTGPMELYEGLTPTFSTHMDQPRTCSPCHTLITQSVDLAGNLTGGEFVEQATYHEYLNSSYVGTTTKCQSCHMPKLEDPIVIANGVLSLQGRFPFNQHTFAGANYFMLNLIKNNKTALNIDSPDRWFDTTITATSKMLREKSIDLTLLNDGHANDTAYFRVKIKNKTGHKFPSGYPARRAVVQFVVLDASNDTLFKSGIFTPQYRVIGENPQFETHHNIINQSNKPQIYEMVMGDVNSNFTSVLERAANLLKDNRIPPAGFTTTHAVYDTVKISNDALADNDFNKVLSVEGSGEDYVHFHVPLSGYTGNIQVKTKVYYQSVPPKWVDEMFTLSGVSAPINTFKNMYQSADQTPFLVAADSINTLITSINTINKPDGISVFPTLTSDGKVSVISNYGNFINSIEVINASGATLQRIFNTNYQSEFSIQLPETAGVYYIRIRVGNKIITKKVAKS